MKVIVAPKVLAEPVINEERPPANCSGCNSGLCGD